MKYLWLALFVLFAGVASYFAEELFFPHRSSFSPESPEAIIYQDLKELDSRKNLPSELGQISEVYFSDHRIQKTNVNWIELSKIYFPRRSEGIFELQIEAFDAPAEDSKKDSAISIFQFSLFDKGTKNKVWELSRTYNFNLKPQNIKK